MKHYTIDSALFAAKVRADIPEAAAIVEQTLRVEAFYESGEWTALLKRARLDRAERVERRPTWEPSLASAASEAGIVPHPPVAGGVGTTRSRCDACRFTIRVNRNAASLLRYRAKHALPGSIYGDTVWGEAFRATSRR